MLAGARGARRHGHGGAAAELGLEDVAAAAEGGRHADDAEHQRAAPEHEAEAQPVDVGVQRAGERRHRDREHGDALGVEAEGVEAQEHLRDDQAGGQRAEYADAHDQREALDLGAREPVQHHDDDEVRHVAVDDGRGGATHGGLDGLVQALLAVDQLLAQALVDEHVAVDGDAQVQRDAGEAGQREAGVHQGHRVEDDQRVHQQRDVGDDARQEVVERHHREGGGHRDQHAVEAALEVVLAHGRAEDAHRDGLGREPRAERAGGQHADEVVDFLLAEVAGDLATVADLGVEVRRGVDLVVQDDGHGLAHVGAREAAHLGAAGIVELEADGGAAEFVGGTADLLHRPFLAAGLMDQAAVRGGPEQDVDALVRARAGHQATRGEVPGRVGLEHLALGGGVRPLVDAVDLEPARHRAFGGDGAALGELLAELLDVHAQGVLRGDGDAEVEHARAAEQALEVLGVIERGALGGVGVVERERGIDFSSGGRELGLELGDGRVAVLALLGGDGEHHHARPAARAERARLHLGARRVVGHFGGGGGIGQGVEVGTLLAGTRGGVVGGTRGARCGPGLLQRSELLDAGGVALGEVGGLAGLERGIELARGQAGLGEERIERVRVGLLRSADIVARQRHDHLDAVLALRRHGEVEHALRVDAVLERLDGLLEELALRGGIGAGRHVHRVDQADAAAQVAAELDLLLRRQDGEHHDHAGGGNDRHVEQRALQGRE